MIVKILVSSSYLSCRFQLRSLLSTGKVRRHERAKLYLTIVISLELGIPRCHIDNLHLHSFALDVKA